MSTRLDTLLTVFCVWNVINHGFCTTIDEVNNIPYLEKCPYNHLNYHDYLPHTADKLNQFMCNHAHQNYVCGKQRREGLLCSKCQGGLDPTVQYTHHALCRVSLVWGVPIFMSAMVFCLINQSTLTTNECPGAALAVIHWFLALTSPHVIINFSTMLGIIINLVCHNYLWFLQHGLLFVCLT